MPARAPLLFAVTLLLTAGRATAQQPGSEEPAQSIAHAAAAAERVGAELACLRARQVDLERVLGLMRQAEAQLRSPSANEAARRDARLSIVSLEQRAMELDRDARACRVDRSPFPADHLAPGTHVVAPPPDPAAQAVAVDAASLRRVERDVDLARGVRVVIAEQVDGTGQIEAEAIRRAVRGIAGRLAQCHDRMMARGRFPYGQIDLVFTVTPAGRVVRVAVEGDELPDRDARQCVLRAGQLLRVGTPALGGDATYSYRLRLGASAGDGAR